MDGLLEIRPLVGWPVGGIIWPGETSFNFGARERGGKKVCVRKNAWVFVVYTDA